MKTYPLYQYDSYVKELEAEIIKISEDGIILDKTIFYPGGGGQIYDTGYIIRGSESYRVSKVFKQDDEIIHVVERPGLNEGDKVLLKIDWERRYRIMRMHTSLHIIGAVMYKDYNVLITGSNIYEDRARIDFPMEEMNKEVAIEIVSKANNIAKTGHEVKVHFMPVEEAMKRRELFRLKDFSKYLKYLKDKVRIIEIVDIDIELDGGTHVKNTREIGDILFMKYESKGRKNRRIYITVSP